MKGARDAYPFVMKLMLNMDPEHTPPAATAADGADDAAAAAVGDETQAQKSTTSTTNSRREATEQLSEVLAPDVYEAVTGTMGDVATDMQTWKLLEVEVKQAWVHGIATFDSNGNHAGETTESARAAAAVFDGDDDNDDEGDEAGKKKALDSQGSTVRVQVTLLDATKALPLF